MNPSRPISMKAARQPKVSAIQGTTSGATIAPTVDPLLNRPTANACALTGNHSEVAFTAHGKFPDSPRPSNSRTLPNPATDRTKP